MNFKISIMVSIFYISALLQASDREKLIKAVYVFAHAPSKNKKILLTPETIQIAPDSMIVAHPSLSDDGLTLYFASNIKGGFGGIDVWKMTLRQQ